MELQVDIDDLSSKVAKHMLQQKNVWEEYVPIVESDNGLDIYLFESVNAPAVYAEMYHKLLHLPEDKTATIHINNRGGYEQGASTICEALRNTKAKTVGKLSGLVASAATIITMECDDITVAPDTMFMIHESSFDNLGGKFSDMKSFQDFYNNHTRATSKASYLGFLTEEEIERIHNGKELWFNADEVLTRWGKRKELRNEK